MLWGRGKYRPAGNQISPLSFAQGELFLLAIRPHFYGGAQFSDRYTGLAFRDRAESRPLWRLLLDLTHAPQPAG